MHLKSAVIFCALYFVSVTQSIGLTENQLKILIHSFRKLQDSKEGFTSDAIVTLGKEIGITNMSAFEYDQSLPDARKLQAFLIFLATNNTTTDEWLEDSLSSYEVRIIVGMFEKCDKVGNKHDGLLQYDEVKTVVNGLNLENEGKDDILGAFGQDELAINAAELLKAILNYKPEGSGLDRDQIMDLITLHNNNKEHINPDELQKYFIKLSIVVEQHNDLLYFKPIPNRTASMELQELVVFTAEYNKDTSQNVPRLSVSYVRKVIFHFSTIDGDKNAVLDKDEIQKLADHVFQNQDKASFIKEYDTDNDGHLNIAEFFLAAFKLQK